MDVISCPICRSSFDPSKGRKRHRVYGGALCCDGCRAFFRRSYQVSLEKFKTLLLCYM